jgi:glyoxylase-like metal-dependent hydrolase (beta-lactamase superfamily II)
VAAILPGDGEEHAGLRAVATPGHAEDHVCFLTGDGVCFSGDLVLGEGSTFVPPDGGSLSAYMESLRRLQGMEIELICPGHGPWVTDPAAKLAVYVEHREMRERRLLAALERGERSRAALLAEAWDDVSEQMRPAAALVMEAHLQKLDAEGRLQGPPLVA